MVPNFTWWREEAGLREVSDEIFFWRHEAKLKLTDNFWVVLLPSTATSWRELSHFHQASDLSCYRKVHFLTKEWDYTHENPSAKVFPGLHSGFQFFPYVSQCSCGDLHGDFEPASELLCFSLLLFMASLERWSPVSNSHPGHGHQTSEMDHLA